MSVGVPRDQFENWQEQEAGRMGRYVHIVSAYVLQGVRQDRDHSCNLQLRMLQFVSRYVVTEVHPAPTGTASRELQGPVRINLLGGYIYIYPCDGRRLLHELDVKVPVGCLTEARPQGADCVQSVRTY
jgi:hypothetical protein